MNILLFGAAGFIGSNLALYLAKTTDNKITLLDRKRELFSIPEIVNNKSITIYESIFDENTEFDQVLQGQDIVYHLVSTTVPGTSNLQIPQELSSNVVATAKMLEACVRCGVKKVIFLSSGGTVYGKKMQCPLHENTPTYPINSYGVQKITIEKLLYLYNYLYGLDYRVVRLANPYGPYQNPNGILGAATTFTYKALKKEEIIVYGDGSVVRDYIYIDDVIRAMANIVEKDSKYKIFNLGSGYGTSIQQLINVIGSTLGVDLKIKYLPERKVDVPVNYLDISRYENTFGKLNPISLEEGIRKTASFLSDNYL